MIRRGRTKGFTVVEILVVVIVMALLATVIVLSYESAHTQARDTQMRDAANKYVDALRLWMAAHNGEMPQGGSVSGGTASTPNDKVGCSGGGTSGWANGNYSSTNYPCTKGAALQAAGYLPSDFFDKLPPTTRYNTNSTNFMIYGPINGKWYLFYSLEKPSDAEAAAYSALSTVYPYSATLKDSYSMNAYQEITNF